MGTAIVAIPAEYDYIWNLSSEKVPHMTLLFLGENVSSEQHEKIRAFVEHVSESGPSEFFARVSSRGVLGPDKADVLFFDYEDVRQMRRARDLLLSNAAIRETYYNTPQFMGWTPHLTMGYPEAPAKPDTREHPGVYSVRFDRIALWTGDYSGWTFPLRGSETSDVGEDAVHSALAKMNKLKHENEAQNRGSILAHKILEGGGSKTVFEESKVKRDGRGRFASKSSSAKNLKNGKLKFNNATAEAILSEITTSDKFMDEWSKKLTSIVQKADYKTLEDFSENYDRSDKALNKEIVTQAMSTLNEYAKSYTNSSGEYLHFETSTPQKPKYRVIKHSDLSDPSSFLAHYGVKGMRWGVRRSDRQLAAAAAKRSSISSMSNEEMQQLITRMDLEQRYSKLLASSMPPPKTTRGAEAAKFVGNLLLDIGKTELTRVSKGATSLQIEKMLDNAQPGITGQTLAARIKPKKK